MRRAALLLAAAAILGLAGWAVHDPVRELLRQDRCLDAGGRWLAAEARCEFGEEPPAR